MVLQANIINTYLLSSCHVPGSKHWEFKLEGSKQHLDTEEIKGIMENIMYDSMSIDFAVQMEWIHLGKHVL